MPFPFDDEWRRRFTQAVRRWFRRHARDLPWRQDRDPFKVWVSEVMLQQTTVEAAKPYFKRFIERFPTVGALAAADEAEVLRYWQGLGYYSRARNLHRAAKMVVEQLGGSFPKTPAGWQALPGIGRYTAAAIVSLAYDQRAAILEANTQRLYARLLAYRQPLHTAAAKKALWAFAAWLVPSRSVSNFNQALMDLGATVCTPKEPSCAKCPVRSCCLAYEQGLQHSIPPPTKRQATVDLFEVCAVAVREGQILMVQRAREQWWSGLWDLPVVGLRQKKLIEEAIRLDQAARKHRLETARRSRHQTSANQSDRRVTTVAGLDLQLPVPSTLRELVSTHLINTFGLNVKPHTPLTLLDVVRYTVTRHRVTRLAVRLTVSRARLPEAASISNARWVSLEDLRELALPTPARRVLQLL